MAIESTYGTPETTGFLAFRILDESLSSTIPPLAQSNEMSGSQALEDLEVGRHFVEGSIVIEGKHNAAHLWRFICHAMGGMEVRTVGHLPDSTITGQTDLATHLFLPQALTETTTGSENAVPPGMTLRIWKAGATKAGGYADVFTGAIITSWSWEQDDGQSEPTITLNFIAKRSPSLSTTALGVTDILPVRALTLRDLSRTHSYASMSGKITFGFGSEFDIDSFRINVNANIGFADGFLNNIDALNKPGHSGGWDVTGSVTTRLKQNYYALAPYSFFKGGNQDLARQAIIIRYTSAEDAGTTPTNYPEAVQINLPAVVMTREDDSLSDPGEAPVDFDLVCEEGLLSAIAGTSAYNTQLAIQCCVKVSSDGDSGAAFCTPAEGGNPAPMKVN